MDFQSLKFQEIERLYNMTVKTAFKFPAKASKETVNSFLGVFNMGNIVMRNYGSNAIKWQRTYQEDIYTHKADIGFLMDHNLSSI